MDLTGEHRIPASRETVWKALNDPEILKQCIPGCEKVEKLSDTEFTANIVLSIGPMKAKFSGKGTLSDLDPPNGYTITGEGQGGVAGFGKGTAKVALSDDGDQTLMRYKADAQVGGKIAQLGARLIDATSRKLADEFFSRFAAVVGGAAAAAAAPAPTSPTASSPIGSTPIADDAAPAGASAAAIGAPQTMVAAPFGNTGVEPRTLPPSVWITGLVLVVALILWWFTRA